MRKRVRRVQIKPILLKGLQLLGFRLEPSDPVPVEIGPEVFAHMLENSYNSAGRLDGNRDLFAARARTHYIQARQAGAAHQAALEAAGRELACSSDMIDKGLQYGRDTREKAFAFEYRAWRRAGHCADAAILHAMYNWGYSDAIVVDSSGHIERPAVLRGAKTQCTGEGGYVLGLEAALAALKRQGVEGLDDIELRPRRVRN
jgi:hypothetical protein